MSTIARKDPLAALLRRAATLPATTGETARYQQRIDSAGVGTIIVADVSASMAEPAGERRKVEILRDALATAPPSRIVAFSSAPRELTRVEDLPSPSGGTALHLALDAAAAMAPAQTLVISDGEPDSESAALAAADLVPGTIDVLYCGPADNIKARDFLLRLARAGGGRYTAHDLRTAPMALGPAIRGLLAAPSGRSR